MACLVSPEIQVFLDGQVNQVCRARQDLRGRRVKQVSMGYQDPSERGETLVRPAEAYLDLLANSAPKVTKAPQVRQVFLEPQVSQERRAVRVLWVRWGSLVGQEIEAFRGLPRKGPRETKACPGHRETQVHPARQDLLEFREA